MNNKQTIEPEFDEEYAKEQIRRSLNPLRRFIKRFYLLNILKDVRGPSVDFGCGAGQLLRRMPLGSVGIEVNPHLIESLHRSGLTVHKASADISDFELRTLRAGAFETLVIAHVVEHLPDPVSCLETLLTACARIGITRVIVVVPGAKGFASDKTHKTFVDRAFLKANLPRKLAGYSWSDPTFFPGNWEWIGRYFVFHEMKIVFDQLKTERQ